MGGGGVRRGGREEERERERGSLLVSTLVYNTALDG